MPGKSNITAVDESFKAKLEEFFRSEEKGPITTSGVMRWCGVEPSRHNHGLNIHVGKKMKQAGWVKAAVIEGDRVVPTYTRPRSEDEQDALHVEIEELKKKVVELTEEVWRLQEQNSKLLLRTHAAGGRTIKDLFDWFGIPTEDGADIAVGGGGEGEREITVRVIGDKIARVISMYGNESRRYDQVELTDHPSSLVRIFFPHRVFYSGRTRYEVFEMMKFICRPLAVSNQG